MTLRQFVERAGLRFEDLSETGKAAMEAAKQNWSRSGKPANAEALQKFIIAEAKRIG